MEKQGIYRKYIWPIGRFFLANILDIKGRIDTGRIGQFIGMFSLTLMSTWATWQLLFYQEAKGPISQDRLKLFSMIAAFPLALASMKDFWQAGGTAVKPHFVMPSTGFLGFLAKNLLDQYGRINIERIGHIFGLVNLALITVYVQCALYFDFKIDVELATVLSADSGFPMLLYRVKDWFAKKAPALAEAVQPKREKEAAGTVPAEEES
jgi:hypothetical protein